MSMIYFLQLLPIILLILHFSLAYVCIAKLTQKRKTRMFSKEQWVLIIIFLGLLGPIAYLLYEERDIS